MPVYTEGNFSLLQHDRVKVMEDQFYNGSVAMKELNKPINSAQCILNHQTPTLLPKFQNSLVVGVSVLTWRSCNMAISGDTVEACDLTGGEGLGVTKDDFDLNGRIKVEFEVSEEIYDSMATFEMILAKQAAKAKVLCEVELAQRLVTFASTNADTVSLAGIEVDVTATVNGNTIEIPSAEWSSTVLGEMEYIHEQFDMMNVLYVTGKNFYTEDFLNKYKNQSCCNNADLLRSNDFEICFDSRNVDSVLGGRYTLAIEEDAIFFWNAYKHNSTTPINRSSANDLWEWRETLPRLTYKAMGLPKPSGYSGDDNPIWIDVTMQRVCAVVNDRRVYSRKFEYIISYGLFNGPIDCNDRVGILKYAAV